MGNSFAKRRSVWLGQGEISQSRLEESEQSFDLIASESRRCGELVKNLLTFSRTAPMNPEPTDLSAVANQSLCPAIEETFRVRCCIMPDPLDPECTLHSERHQYYSSEILRLMQDRVGPQSWRLVGVAAVDLYIPILTFVFGGRRRCADHARWSRHTVCGRSFTDYPKTPFSWPNGYVNRRFTKSGTR